MTTKLKTKLESDGYFDIKEIPNRGIVALLRFVFTVGLVYGIDENGYVGRYCYPSLRDAKEGLNNWDGSNDPSGNWIKHKGHIEYSNKNLNNNEKGK